MTPGDRFNEVALLVMGSALARPGCLLPLLLLRFLPLPLFFFVLFLQSHPPGLPNRDVRVYGCLFPSGNHCFMAGFYDESVCLPSFISPHSNLNLFVFVCPLPASKLPHLLSLSVGLSLIICLRVGFFSNCFFIPALCVVFEPPLSSFLQYMRQQCSD